MVSVMKKTFPFELPNHKPERVVERIKSEVRKYLKRERRKTLPDNVDYWDFACRAGEDMETAPVVHVEELISAVDAAREAGWDSVYLEILARPGVRQKKTQVRDVGEESGREIS